LIEKTEKKEKDVPRGKLAARKAQRGGLKPEVGGLGRGRRLMVEKTTCWIFNHAYNQRSENPTKTLGDDCRPGEEE